MTSTYTSTNHATAFLSGKVNEATDEFYFDTATLTKHLKGTASSPATSNGFYLSTIMPSLQQNSKSKLNSVASSVTSSNTQSATRTTDFPSTSVMTSAYTLTKDVSVFVSSSMNEVTDDFYFDTVTLTKQVIGTASKASLSSSPATSNGFFHSTITPSLQQNTTAKMYSTPVKIHPTKSSQQSLMSSQVNGAKGNSKIKDIELFRLL